MAAALAAAWGSMAVLAAVVLVLACLGSRRMPPPLLAAVEWAPAAEGHPLAVA